MGHEKKSQQTKQMTHSANLAQEVTCNKKNLVIVHINWSVRIYLKRYVEDQSKMAAAQERGYLSQEGTDKETLTSTELHEEYLMMVTVGTSDEGEHEENTEVNTEECVRKHDGQLKVMMEMLVEIRQKLDEPIKEEEKKRR